MICETCNGSGMSETPGIACFDCDGVGEKCDICGETSDAPGVNICSNCDEEGGEQ
jgi:hypothetical protein